MRPLCAPLHPSRRRKDRGTSALSYASCVGARVSFEVLGGWDSCQAQPFPPALRAVSAAPEGPGMQKRPGPTPLASACSMGP